MSKIAKTKKSRRPSLDTSQTVSRAIAILRGIARQSFDGLRLTDISAITGLPMGTTHRLLKSLIKEGMVRQDSKNGRYGLGVLNYELGLATFDRPYIHRLHPKIQRLANLTDDTVFVFARSGHEVVCLDRAESRKPRRRALTNIGSRVPLCIGAAGLSLIAQLRDTEVNIILAACARDIERHPILTAATIRNEIREVRRKGYSFVKDHIVVGVSTISIVLSFDETRPPLAISVSSPTEYLPENRAKELYALMANLF